MRVPTYGTPTVQRDALPNSFLQPVNDDAGRIVGGALENFGNDLAQTAANQRAALGVVARNMEADQATHDDAWLKEQQIKYSQAITTQLYDPKTGLYSQEGRNALDLAPSIDKALRNSRDDLLGQAQTPRQRQALEQWMDAHDLQINASKAEFLSRQTKQYDQQMSIGKIATLQNRAVAAYSVDPAVTSQALAEMQLEQQTMDAKQGIPVEYHVLNTLKNTSQVWGGVAHDLLSRNDVVGAKQVLDDHAGEMTAEARIALQGPVEDGMRTYNAQAALHNVVTGGLAGAHDGEAPGALSPASLPKPPALGVNAVADQVRSLAKAAGKSPAEAERMVRDAMFESGLNPSVHPNGSSTGLFQFSTHRGPHGEPSTWDQFGSGDIHDVGNQVQAKIKLDAFNHAMLTKALGRAPTDEEMYIAHQQGPGGSRALLTAPPEVSAVAALEGAGVSHGRAVASIRGNLKKSLQGEAETITAGQFVDYLKASWSGKVVAAGQAVASSPTASATPNALPDRETLVNQMVAQAGSDPVQQQRNRAAAEQYWNDQHAAMEQKRSAAWDAAQPFLQQNIPIAQWPAEVRANLAPEHVTSIMQSQAKGENRKTDEAFLFHARQLYATNPDEFLKIDPSKAMAALNPTDFKEFSGWQAEAIKNRGKALTEHQWTSAKLLEAGKLALGMHGIDSTPLGPHAPHGQDPGRTPAQVQADYAMLNKFTSHVQQAIANHVATFHKQPGDADVQRYIDAALLTGTWRATDGAGQSVVRAHKPIFLAPDGTPINYDIPAGQRSQIEASLRRHGQPVNHTTVLNTWLAGKARGLIQ